MTPAQILALVRDIGILCALAFLVFRIYSDGESAVKAKDLIAVQQQLTQNSERQSQWAQEAHDAAIQHTQDLAQVVAVIGAQRAPVILQPAPTASGACPVPGHPPTPTGEPAAAGGVDIRAGINAFELKYETALADCRQVLSSWPKVTP